MSYIVKVSWKKKPDEDFLNKKYSRVHKWVFDGGIEVRASSSPHVVRLPFSDPSAVDPEEAFLAAVASCHMLSFLYEAAKKNFIPESYEDNAEGILAKNDEGKMAMTQVTLKPEIIFSKDNIPNREQLEELHHLAHEECFIASSVKTKIDILIIENEAQKNK